MHVNGMAFVIILGYYLIVNLINFSMMAFDKSAAIKGKRRVPEKNFYILAVIGGGFGGLISMVIKHHKTHHLDFIMVFTITAVLHVLAIYLLIGKFAVTFT